MPFPSLHILDVGGVRVVCCSQHGSCYTQDTLDRHLADLHKVKRQQRLELLSEYCAAGLASTKEDVQQPQDGSPAFDSLPVLQGYRCQTRLCSYTTTNKGAVAKHCRGSHKWSSGVKGRRRKQQEQH